MLLPMFLRHFASALAATSLVVGASSLVGCGQKSELYLPAKNGSQESYAEHKNVKSHFIFGSSVSKATATNPSASEPTVPAASAPASTQPVTGGSAS